MKELIPAFNFNTVVVEPWVEFGADNIWIVLMGFLVALSCGLVGNYLILRRMALVGDAISHSVLPGLAGAFLVASFLGGLGWFGGEVAGEESMHHDYRNSSIMFLGALVAGILTTLLIELIHKKSRVKQDAAIGITFSSLFAIGVILISLFADRIDLDADCVLYGEISYVMPGLQPMVTVGGVPIGLVPVVRMGAVAVLTIMLVLLFYKELLVSSFDSGLASSLGINSTFTHYALMCWLSIVVVSAFESVGAILVIAMLILPGATAQLLSQRFPVVLLLTAAHALVSAVLGLHIGMWLNCTIAGAMVVAGAGLFVLSWLLSPSTGLIWQLLRRRNTSMQTVALATQE